jgi:hypothetical protein
MAHMLVPPKMHFQHLLLLDSMLGERHIRHAPKFQRKIPFLYSMIIVLGAFLKFFFPPMTSTNVPLN